MVTRWVSVIEVVDGEGHRYVYAMAPDGAMAWDSLGLLTYAIQIEQSANVRDAMRGD